MRGVLIDREHAQRIAFESVMRVKLRPHKVEVVGGVWTRHPYQVRPPGEWAIWVLEGGRGSGKTRTGAEEVLQHIEKDHGGPNCHVGVGAPTNGDVRDICFEEESGIMGAQVGARDRFLKYNRQALEAVHRNGATINGYGSEEPARWNGRNFCYVWHDEGSLENPESIEQSLFALRKKYLIDGVEQQPRMLITTTPKPFKHIRALKEQPTTVVTRGTMYDNQANLSLAAVAELKRKYEGTTLGRRELLGEDIDDVDGALWNRGVIEAYRRDVPAILLRVVVAIDPSASNDENSDETGIIVAGMGDDGHGYVLDDVSLVGSPHERATAAIDAYRHWQADRVVGEVNNGGDMIEYMLRTVDPNVPYTAVHASRGKQTRAEPIAAMYEQGRWHHVGRFPDLEDQMCTWVPGMKSPDRMDALVWAATELFIELNDAVSFRAGVPDDARVRIGADV